MSMENIIELAKDRLTGPEVDPPAPPDYVAAAAAALTDYRLRSILRLQQLLRDRYPEAPMEYEESARWHRDAEASPRLLIELPYRDGIDYYSVKLVYGSDPRGMPELHPIVATFAAAPSMWLHREIIEKMIRQFNAYCLSRAYVEYLPDGSAEICAALHWDEADVSTVADRLIEKTFVLSRELELLLQSIDREIDRQERRTTTETTETNHKTDKHKNEGDATT